jgi:hypothetical protein
MGQDPSEIREEIDETRARMGETVEALGYKTDVTTAPRRRSPARSGEQRPTSVAPARA